VRHCAGVRSHASLGRAHTRLPLSSATWAHFCISGNRPRAVDNLRQREGHWQPTSVTALGGPAASIQLRQGPRAAGGPGNLPTARPAARGPAHRSVGRAVRSCSCSWVAAGQARCGRPGTNARPLLRAGAACIAPCKPVASDRRLGARPRQNGSCRYVRYRSTDCARLTARVLCATKHDNCAGASVA
jgi:hypothetical protein